MNPSHTFASLLADQLREKGYANPNAFAVANDMNAQTIHRLLNGERKPSWAMVQQIATALGVSTDVFRDQ